MNHGVIVITGPTAVGKTAAALMLCKRLNGELVNADAMQVYRGMDIGTAKAGSAERAEIPHHLIDIRHVNETYNVVDYVRDATESIRQIQARDHIAIVCGGTGLYIQSLVEGIVYPPEARDPVVRANLERLADLHGVPFLRSQLAAVDPCAAERLPDGDRRRIIRALEVYQTTGRPASVWIEKSKRDGPSFSFFAYCLTLPRPVLYNRIDERVEKMIASGLPREAAAWYAANPGATARQAIGYKEFIPWLEGQADLAQVTAAVKQATRRYAKRQLTWFRRMRNLTWLDHSDPAHTLETITNHEFFAKFV